MRAAQRGSEWVVLRSRKGKRRKPVHHARVGRAISKDALLRSGEDIGFIGGDGLYGKPQTGKAVDETDGLANPLLHTPNYPHRPCCL